MEKLSRGPAKRRTPSRLFHRDGTYLANQGLAVYPKREAVVRETWPEAISCEKLLLRMLLHTASHKIAGSSDKL